MKPHESASPIDDARWQAQERARRGEAEADPLDLRIAHALRAPPPVALPQDFAARVASLAQARAVADLRL